MAKAVRLTTNPDDPDQYYVLYDNGKVIGYGGAPPVTGIPEWFNFVGPQAPARALVIINWTTPSGYIMDFYGQVYPFGGTSTPSGPSAVGVAPFAIGVDLVMDPAGNGAGYRLFSNGAVDAIGGATAVAAGPSFAGLTGKRLVMEWSSKKYYVLAGQGGIYPRNGAPAITVGPGWPGWDIARDLKIYDWSAGKGWLLDGYGGVHPINNAQSVFGFPYWKGNDTAVEMSILDDGTGAGPLEIRVLNKLGNRPSFVVSTAPTATILEPTGTVTDTSRPDIRWGYSDAEGDAQYRYQVALYTSSNHSMLIDSSNPFLHSSDKNKATQIWDKVSRGKRGVTPDVDLKDGGWHVYVRVRDTSNMWSDAGHASWTQGSGTITTPTVVATPQATGISVTTTHSSPGPLDLHAVLWVDPSGDFDYVRDGDALDASSGTTTVVDYEAPLGEPRAYFAVAYQADPHLSSDESDSVVATLPDRVWRLTSTADPDLGGEVDVEEPFTFARDAVAGVFRGAGAKFPIVVSDGVLKASAHQLNVRLLSKADYDRLEGVLTSDSTLLLRDPLGRAWYCRIVGTVAHTILRAAKTSLEDYPIRHAHTVPVPLVEVQRPAAVAPPDLVAIPPDTDFYA